MNTSFYILTALILGGLGVTIYYLRELLERREDDASLKMMQDWMQQVQSQTQQTRREIQERLDKNQSYTSKRLDRTHQEIGDRLDNAAKVIGKVQRELGSMSEIGRQMQSLQDFLQSPKLRGNIGEEVMKDLLSQQIPHEQFALQYSFADGTIVDAIVKTDRGIIPIDSKFPRENFKKMLGEESEADRAQAKKAFINDVRKHVRDISSKYILPDEGTLDFAIMYIPSESIAYEVMINSPELVEYARERHVVPVSPNQFNYYLKVIMIGLEGKRIEERAEQIMLGLKRLSAEVEKFDGEFSTLLTHINNAKNKADSVSGQFNQLHQKLDNLRALDSPDEKQQNLLK